MDKYRNMIKVDRVLIIEALKMEKMVPNFA